MARIKEKGASPGVVLSINVPDGDIKGVVVAPMGGAYLQVTGFETAGEEDGAMLYRPQYSRVQLEEYSDAVL